MTTQSGLDTTTRETHSLIGSDKVEGTAFYRSNGEIRTGNWVTREGAIALSPTVLEHGSHNFIFSKQIRLRLSATSRLETICAHSQKWLQNMKTKSAEPATSTLTTPTPTPTRKPRGSETGDLAKPKQAKPD
jgi:hypothetical protein